MKLPADLQQLREEALQKYESVREVKGWRKYFVAAAKRIDTWSVSMREDINLDTCIQEFEKSKSVNPVWYGLFPSINYLLDVVLHGPVTDVIGELIDLNNELMVENAQLIGRQRDDNILIRDLYQLVQKDAQGFVAALALFDVHVSNNEEFGIDKRFRSLDLIPSVFGVIAEGFGIWALYARWHRVYAQLTEPEGFLEISKQVEAASLERDKLALNLISEYKRLFAGPEFDIRRDPRGILGSYQVGYYNVDVADTIYLQITCPNPRDCYSALAWVESLGKVQIRLVRSSLFHGEQNGAMRLQTAVRLANSHRLLITRIGTVETHLRNEWGAIAKLINEEPLIDQVHLVQSKSSREIVVYNTYGIATILKSGSTLADYILTTYGEEDARYCSDANVNANKTNLGYKLSSGDVVHVTIDRHHKGTLPQENWYGEHVTVAARQMMDTITRSNQDIVERGRMRFILMVQEFLRKWEITLAERDIQFVLNVAGIRNRTDRDKLFRSFAASQVVDRSFCQLFLQYYLRGRILLEGGHPIELHWKDIKIAPCCTPKFSDAIIGTQAFGPHDPSDPRFGSIRRINIHTKECLKGPSQRNAIEVIWSTKGKLRENWGLQISYLLRDGRGLLGEIMDFIYENTSLSIHYLSADAVNFGINKAQIVLLATAATELEINEAQDKLKEMHRNRISFKKLNDRDVRLMVPEKAYCPYILASDPQLTTDAPTIMVGRIDEINRLKGYINDPRINTAMVVGYFRNGKTWFLKHFKTNYNLPGHYSLYISYDAKPETLNPAEMPKEMYRQIIYQLAAYSEIKINGQRPNSLSGLSSWLNDIAQKNNCTFSLLLDEFSGIDLWIRDGWLDKSFLNHFIRFMRDTKSTNFILVFQAAQFYNLIDDQSGFVDFFRSRISEGTIEIKPFAKHEVSEFLNDPVSEYYRVDGDAVDLVTALSGGSPYLCAKLGGVLWRAANRSNFEQIDRSALTQIWKNSLRNDGDWYSTLNRMIEKIPEQLVNFLSFISAQEFEKKNDSWWQDAGSLWVPQSKILRFLKNKVSISPDQSIRILDRLEISSLLHSKTEGKEPSWRLASDLLAYKLANKNFRF